jgi:hypothetical protein
VLEDHRVTGTDDHVLRVVVTSLHELEPLIDELNEHGKPATMLVCPRRNRGRACHCQSPSEPGVGILSVSSAPSLWETLASVL